MANGNGESNGNVDCDIETVFMAVGGVFQHLAYNRHSIKVLLNGWPGYNSSQPSVSLLDSCFSGGGMV